MAHTGCSSDENRRVAAEVGAHHHRVDEEPDLALELGARAVGRAARHGDVVLAGVPREEHLERRQQRDVQGHAVALAQRLQRLRDLAIEGGVDVVAAERLHRGARPIGGQLQGLQTGELLPPEGQVRLDARGRQALPPASG